VLGFIFGFGLLFYIVAFALVIIRRNKSPLRDRSPYLLLISAIFGALGLAYMYSRLYFDLILVCPITYYVIGVCQLTYFLPYLLRCFRTILQWKLAQAQSEIMKENEILNSVKKGRGDTVQTNMPLTSSVASSIDQSVKEESVELSEDEPKERKKRGAVMFKSIAKSEKYSRLINNQFYFSERFLVIFMIVIFILWVLIIFVVHMILLFSSNYIDPLCQKRCNEHEGIAVRVYVCITIALIIPFALLLFFMRKIEDDFSIRNEMLVMLLFSIVIVAIPMIVLLAVPGAW